MSLQCVITGCQRTANVLCYCCKENLCRNHYNEHDYLNSKLNLLADQIDSYERELLSVDLKKYLTHSNDRLQQWRLDAYKAIDHYCEDKYREIEQYCLKILQYQRENLEQLRKEMLEIVDKRQMTLEMIETLTGNLQRIESEVNQMDQKYLSIETSPVILDKNLIRIEQITTLEKFDLSTLSSVFQTIEYTRQGLYPIASNDQYLLIHREPNICLIDRNFKLRKQILWTHGQILDMCWSSALSQFFLLTLNQLYIFDLNNQMSTIERVDSTQKLQWASCTCSNTSLFLSTFGNGSAICEFNLLNAFQAAKRWDSPDSCERNERIRDICYNKGTLLLMIENPTSERIRLELRSAARLDRLWILQLEIDYQSKVISCCLFQNDQWLIIDGNASRLFQISMDGKLKSSCFYNPIPCCATLFSEHLLAISTIHGVNFHKV